MKSQTPLNPSSLLRGDTPDLSNEGADELRRLRSINPRDGRPIGEVMLLSPHELKERMERAREAQRAWMRRPVATRVRRAERLTQDLLSWRAELLDLLVEETGKSPVEDRQELWNTCEELAQIAGSAEELLAIEKTRSWSQVRSRQRSWQPRGLVAVFASAYSPLHSALAPAVAAMIAGNAVIVVPDHRAPLVVESLLHLAGTAGIPEALFQSGPGDRQVIEGLAEEADAIVSYAPMGITRRLARVAAGSMTPLMGRWPTSDAMIVLGDADVPAAAEAAVRAACSGAGQAHRALARIYVQDTVADPFLDALVEAVGRLKAPQKASNDITAPPMDHPGPLMELEDLQRLEELVREATNQGARVIAGGRIRPRSQGHFFQPTILHGVDESMRLWSAGCPGPVLSVATFGAPVEAVLRLRSVQGYGQVALFSRSRSVIDDLTRRLGAPLVGVNTFITDVPADESPISGSFRGPLDPLGAHRLRALSHPVVQIEDRLSLKRALNHRPAEQAIRLMDSALSLVHRQGLLRRATEAIWPPR